MALGRTLGKALGRTLGTTLGTALQMVPVGVSLGMAVEIVPVGVSRLGGHITMPMYRALSPSASSAFTMKYCCAACTVHGCWLCSE